MSLDADLIVDRRRMRRKLTFWRVVAFGLIILAIVGVATLLSWAMRVSISPDTSHRSHAARWFATRRWPPWSSPLALHQSALGDQPQNPAEDFLMDLVRQATSFFDSQE